MATNTLVFIANRKGRRFGRPVFERYEHIAVTLKPVLFQDLIVNNEHDFQIEMPMRGKCTAPQHDINI
jgi:hypothetical protein